MNNFAKKVWLGAFLHPERWLWSLTDRSLWLTLGGAVIFAAAGFLPAAAIMLIAFFLQLGYKIATPEQIYLMKLSDKTLWIEIFENDFKRRKRADTRRKTAIIRLIAEYAGADEELHWPGGKAIIKNGARRRSDFSEIVWTGRKVFGYDDALAADGVFLVKTNLAEWSAICDGFEGGKILGRKICSGYVFADRIEPGQNRLTFIHGARLIAEKAAFFEAGPNILVPVNGVFYTEFAPDGTAELATFKAPYLPGDYVVYQQDDRLRLAKFCLGEHKRPGAYRVCGTGILLTLKNKTVRCEADEEGFLSVQGKPLTGKTFGL